MHYLHACKKTPEGYTESLNRNYGWPEEDKRLALNMEAADGHEGKCPYCGMLEKDMTPAKSSEVRMLNRRPGHWEQ